MKISIPGSATIEALTLDPFGLSTTMLLALQKPYVLNKAASPTLVSRTPAGYPEEVDGDENIDSRLRYC